MPEGRRFFQTVEVQYSTQEVGNGVGQIQENRQIRRESVQIR
jgi:hypothetical protein